MSRHCAAAVLSTLVLAGCAKHVPEPTPHPSAPHVTWSIAEGYGDKEVCRSTKASRCVLTLSDEQPNRRVGVFHVFLHAAATDTKYEGTVTIGFLAGSSGGSHVQKVDRTVPRGSDPLGISSTGIVKPAGKHYVEISLIAAPAKNGAPAFPIKDRVEVEVK